MIYVVIAYRWGYQDNHSYLVSATTDGLRANNAAMEETLRRGGKYSATIYEFEDGQTTNEQVGETLFYNPPILVKHYPSRYDETEPRLGWSKHEKENMILEMRRK